MSKTIAVEPDGSLLITDNNGGVKNPTTGEPQLSVISITPQNIAHYRRDPAFETALQAAKDTAGNLTSAQLATLPAPLAAQKG